MLLTVNGPRSSRELAELVKALMDSSSGGGQGDLLAVLAQVEKSHHISVPRQQRDQLHAVVALALPPEDTAAARDPGEAVAIFVARRLNQDPKVLYNLLMSCWMALCARADDEAIRESEERERAGRDPVAYALGRLALTGRYFVVAHNGRGKPVLSEAVIGLGLAAGAVAELVMSGRVAVQVRTHQVQRTENADDDRRWGEPASAAGDPDAWREPMAQDDPAEAGDAAGAGSGPALSRAAQDAFAQFPAAQPTPLREYLAGMAAGIEHRVRTELVEDGIVTAQTHRMLRERTFYAPVERTLAKAVRTEVGQALLSRDPIAPADAVLAELAIATGLDAKHSSGWDWLASLARGDVLAKTDAARTATTAQLKLLVDLTAAEVDAVVTSPGM